MIKHSLQSDYPEIAKEWDSERNGQLTPDNVSPGSTEKAYFICPKGHSYYARIDHRTIMHSGCPFCAHKKPIVGETDLATVYPDIASEWDHEKNEKSPQNYLAYSNKVVSWKCPYCGHSYEKAISARTLNKYSCPICSKEKGTSFPEQSILFYLSEKVETSNRNRDFGKEIDIYLPSINTGVEYNGQYFHRKRKDKDCKKHDALRALGIRLIVIEEGDSNELNRDLIVIQSSAAGAVADCDLEWGIRALFTVLCIDCPHIDVKKDQIKIKEQYIVSRKKDNFASNYPEYAIEWDKDKNGLLRPEYFTCGSNHIAYFDCPVCGTVYRRRIADKARGMGCPVCAGKQLKEGYNDLKTKHPELAVQWSVLNEKGPECYLPGSDFKAIWHCSVCGNDWKAAISSRTSQRTGCPVCAGRVIVSGYNDLETLHPEIAAEWHYEKNGSLLPSQVGIGYNKKCWWLCKKCGNEWNTTVATRVRGRNCPVCGRKTARDNRIKTYIDRHGSLAERFPEIAAQWDYEKNSPFAPEMFSYGSDIKVGWICPDCNNHWDAVISSRTINGNGCPKCGKKRCVVSAQRERIRKRGSLAEMRPDIARQWDYEANAPVTPNDVTAGSKYRAGWICDQGHKWEAAVYSRKRAGCPECAGH